MRIFPWPKKPAPTFRLPKQNYNLWETVRNHALAIQRSDFMEEMLSRRVAQNPSGVMGRLDCATLYALVRWARPSVVVESGGYYGMSSAFILKALRDEGVVAAKLYSIEFDKTCPHGALIPDELREGFVPLDEDIKVLVRKNLLPPSMEMFVHDSSHRYKHMLWEFREFWKRLADRGVLISHDVHFSAAFARFVAETYAHDKQGLLDPEHTGHYEWGRWGYLGFVIKKWQP